MDHQTKIAAVQISTNIPSSTEGLFYILSCLKEAAKSGAKLVLFPELTLTCTYNANNKNTHELSATEIISMLMLSAQEFAIYTVIGLEIIGSPNCNVSVCRYNVLACFHPDGRTMSKYTKINLTVAEKQIWCRDLNYCLPIIQSPFARFGGALGFESYNPLLRMALYARGLDLYLAPAETTPLTWMASMIHIACESRCFVISSCKNRGTCIVSPFGDIMAESHQNEDILYGDIQLKTCVKGRFDLDCVGHYAMNNIFSLKSRLQI